MMNTILKSIPPMITGGELRQALAVTPEYDLNIRFASAAERLIALNNIYEIYYPFEMSTQIYSKLYLALIRSLQKKTTKIAVQQRSQNYRASHGQSYSGIVGGSDSFTIIGRSGIGKSTAISRAISLVGGHKIIETESPHCKIIPVLVVQCPWDSSIKGLFLSILRTIDETLETRYYQDAIRTHATTDLLIGTVSNACLNHIGLLIVDEVQNVVNSKNGRNLIGSLTQLINNCGISIAMVGTPESAPFFEQEYKLARRSLGLSINEIPFDSDFAGFVATLYRYRYVSGEMILTDGIIQWLYEHSGGITSNVVTLIHDAQEIAILDGSEMVTLDTLNVAYRQRLGLLHTHIDISRKQIAAKKAVEVDLPEKSDTTVFEKGLLAKLLTEAKEKEIPFISLLKERLPVTEVPL